ncbi:FMN-binding negative transcriptional regulator [Paraburkholderia sp. BL10I2N1]|uniref:FMN-binding negative transcriptional regulator n=1 Tax=Paraburkholderia sp. BL10I2N1 TaxID=1938796 RepID=UPI00106096F3|nr:FMN-binding negative transcriptional regulator [Paraburkholderia sp. BL10I2N1]
MLVHAHGRIAIIDDERYVGSVIASLDARARSLAATTLEDGRCRDYLDAMVKAIVGEEIEFTRLVGSGTLRQNQEVRDIRGAAEALNARGDPRIGDAVLAAAEEKPE